MPFCFVHASLDTVKTLYRKRALPTDAHCNLTTHGLDPGLLSKQVNNRIVKCSAFNRNTAHRKQGYSQHYDHNRREHVVPSSIFSLQVGGHADLQLNFSAFGISDLCTPVPSIGVLFQLRPRAQSNLALDLSRL